MKQQPPWRAETVREYRNAAFFRLPIEASVHETLEANLCFCRRMTASFVPEAVSVPGESRNGVVLFNVTREEMFYLMPGSDLFGFVKRIIFAPNTPLFVQKDADELYATGAQFCSVHGLYRCFVQTCDCLPAPLVNVQHCGFVESWCCMSYVPRLGGQSAASFEASSDEEIVPDSSWILEQRAMRTRPQTGDWPPSPTYVSDLGTRAIRIPQLPLSPDALQHVNAWDWDSSDDLEAEEVVPDTPPRA